MQFFQNRCTGTGFKRSTPRLKSEWKITDLRFLCSRTACCIYRSVGQNGKPNRHPAAAAISRFSNNHLAGPFRYAATVLGTMDPGSGQQASRTHDRQNHLAAGKVRLFSGGMGGEVMTLSSVESWTLRRCQIQDFQALEDWQQQ